MSKNLDVVVKTYVDQSPTAPNDSSIALMKAVQRRTNNNGKRGKLFGVNGNLKQTNGTTGNSSQRIYFRKLFSRFHLRENTE